jgi:2-isopropylmalate synthase
VPAQLLVAGDQKTVWGRGNGPIAAFVPARRNHLGVDVVVVDYAEHAVTAGTDATAAAYVEAQSADGVVRWGVGLDQSILSASLRAVLGAIHRL